MIIIKKKNSAKHQKFAFCFYKVEEKINKTKEGKRKTGS